MRPVDLTDENRGEIEAMIVLSESLGLSHAPVSIVGRWLMMTGTERVRTMDALTHLSAVDLKRPLTQEEAENMQVTKEEADRMNDAQEAARPATEAPKE